MSDDDTVIHQENNAPKDKAISRMKLAELKEELKRRKLRVSGTKDELITRFRAALALEEEYGAPDDEDPRDSIEEETDHEDDDSESQKTDEDDEPAQRTRRKKTSKRTIPLTFRDVEASLEQFSGDDKTSIKRWIKDFEEMSTLCELSDIQKVAYAKRLLRGSAKLFVTYEKCTKTWKKLKSALKENFSEIVDSHAIHKELSNRKKSSDETYQAYIYKMLEIAAQVNVETRAVIQYIIDGIQEEAVNKTVLYGTTIIKELKEKFIQYETMKNGARSRTKAAKHQEDRKKSTKQQEETATKNKRCFNCGSKEHVSKECPSKDKDTKCFNCNKFGHIASKCANKKKDDCYVWLPIVDLCWNQ